MPFRWKYSQTKSHVENVPRATCVVEVVKARNIAEISTIFVQLQSLVVSVTIHEENSLKLWSKLMNAFFTIYQRIASMYAKLDIVSKGEILAGSYGQRKLRNLSQSGRTFWRTRRLWYKSYVISVGKFHRESSQKRHREFNFSSLSPFFDCFEQTESSSPGLSVL